MYTNRLYLRTYLFGGAFNYVGKHFAVGRMKISTLFKGIGVSYLVTVPLFAVFSFILSRMEFPKGILTPQC